MHMVVQVLLALRLEILAIRHQEHHAAPSIDDSPLSHESKFLVSDVVALRQDEVRWVNDDLVQLFLVCHVLVVDHLLPDGVAGCIL